MKIFITVLIVLALAGYALAGTYTKINKESMGMAQSIQHFEFNGIECMAYRTGNGGGVSCNWEKYNKGIFNK